MGFEINVDILHLAEGAREAARRGAVAIVVDALRCSATTVTALALGATGVLPVLTVEEARCYLGRAGHRVAGERHGAKCEGFDHGNSPTELHRERATLAGRTLVISTSNGTRMVNVAREGAAAVFMGTAVNASAVAGAAMEVARTTRREIVLVAAGEYDELAEEDGAAARLIARRLHALGARVREEALSEECVLTLFQDTTSAEELRRLGYEADVAYCAQQDLYDIAPILVGNHFVPFEVTVRDAVA